MKNNLFNLQSIKNFKDKFELTPEKVEKLEKYINRLHNGEFKGETKGYLAFGHFLEDILDYEEGKNIKFDDNPDVGRDRVEFALKDEDGKFMVIELKGSDVDLDKPQNRANDKRTPVKQAFGYAEDSTKKSGLVNWILVSNYEGFRLYNYGKRIGEYISFNVEDLLDEEEFKYFMFAFSKESHIDSKAINDIINEDYIEKTQLANNFYKLFHETRLMIFKELREVHGIDKVNAISYAQTILDRFIFICFASSRDLLPDNVAHKTILKRIKSEDLRDYEIWRELNYLFKDVNEGRDDKDISGYNGGLFKDDLGLFFKLSDIMPDKDFFKEIQKENTKNKHYKEFIKELHDKLKKEIKPSILKRLNPIYTNLLIISFFEFSEEKIGEAEHSLDIEILGHIFENSIGDIEELKEDFKGRRKKEGIFYTPSYITDYICRNTIIPYLSNNGNSNTVDELIGEYSWSPTEIEKLDKKLENVRILDPACGSGAFLNKAADVLLEIHNAIFDLKLGYTKTTNMRVGKGKRRRTESIKHFDLGVIVFDALGKRQEILLKNIFGVDLNNESVEITKLSLFLKVCQKGKKLPELDNNIKCGNSLIEDPKYTDKPFNWKNRFGNIFNKGGFDIIIGNPPYFNVQSLGANSKEVDYLKNNYPKIWMDKSDILFYFIARSIELSNRYVCFIVSNAFLFADKGKKLRNFILNNAPISKVVNFEKYMVFPDASITTAIIEFDKLKENTITKVISLRNDDYTETSILELINDDDNYFEVELKQNNVFALVNPKIKKLNIKIDGDHDKLADLFHMGKGMETAADPIYSFKDYPSQFSQEFIKKRVSGANMGRYYINPLTDYILYFEDIKDFIDLPNEIKDYLSVNRAVLEDRATVKNEGRPWWRYSRPMHKEYYNLPKLFCSRRAFNNAFSLDEGFNYISFSNMTVIFDTNELLSIKYVLTLLNSKLLTFRYKAIGKQTGGGSYEYFPNGVGKLPIPKISSEEQIPFIKLAEKMIEINNKLQSQINECKSWLNHAFHIKSFSKNLNKFYELSLDEFLNELKKNKINIKDTDNFSALKNGFEKYMINIDSLNLKIKEIDTEIDRMVYKLYVLTEEEIQIIEKNISK